VCVYLGADASASHPLAINLRCARSNKWATPETKCARSLSRSVAGGLALVGMHDQPSGESAYFENVCIRIQKPVLGLVNKKGHFNVLLL
jgi:hypothetical protein